MIYRVIYFVVHFLINFYVLLASVFRCTGIGLHRTTNFILNLLRSTDRTTQNTLRHTRFKKLPNHVGVVLNEKDISFHDLSNVILWCLCLGIRHVSVYDAEGCIKENDDVLIHQTIEKKQCNFHKDAKRYNVVFRNSKHSGLTSESVSNGHIVENFFVHLLSEVDGKHRIVEAAQQFCSDAKQLPSVLSHFCSVDFNKYVKSTVNVPDPELIVLFGPTFSLQGYLPWHVRLSEILWLPTHHSLQLQEFLGVLSRYEKCEQRFGK